MDKVTAILQERARLALDAFTDSDDLSNYVASEGGPSLELGAPLALADLDRLAEILGVPTDYLVSGSSDLDAKLTLIAALRKSDARALRLRLR